MYSNPDSDLRAGVSAKSVSPLEISKSLRQLAEPNLLETFKNLRRNIGYLSVAVNKGIWTSMDGHDSYVGFYDYIQEAVKPIKYRFFVAETGQVLFESSIAALSTNALETRNSKSGFVYYKDLSWYEC